MYRYSTTLVLVISIVYQSISHLRRYTPGWSAVQILSYGVDLLERRKDFASAVKLLDELLTQQIFCLGARGKW